MQERDLLVAPNLKWGARSVAHRQIQVTSVAHPPESGVEGKS